MEITVARKFQMGQPRTFGMMSWDDVVPPVHTLEDQVRPAGVKVDGETAIPFGRYRVIIDMSTRFKRMMPHILDVPGFVGVRIHKGNTELQTEGCILVGMNADDKEIYNCEPAFEKVYDAIYAAIAKDEEVWLTIK